MDLIETKSLSNFHDYLRRTKNTICGRNPICLLLATINYLEQKVNPKNSAYFYSTILGPDAVENQVFKVRPVESSSFAKWFLCFLRFCCLLHLSWKFLLQATVCSSEMSIQIASRHHKIHVLTYCAQYTSMFSVFSSGNHLYRWLFSGKFRFESHWGQVCPTSPGGWVRCRFGSNYWIWYNLRLLVVSLDTTYFWWS